MTQLPESLRNEFAHLALDRFGLRFEGFREAALDFGVMRAANELGLTPERLLWRLRRYDAASAALLIGELTVKETYFFREPLHFQWLTRCLQGQRRPLRLWSAGCATGEEPYSMAIVALETLGAAARASVRVIATDLDVLALERARSAVYRPWSLRDVAEPMVRRWFHGSGDRFALRDEVKELVEFRELNLTALQSEAWPRGVDVVFCRNVMQYLSQKALRLASTGLARSLQPHGIVICAGADPLLPGETLLLERDAGVARYRLASRAAAPRKCSPAIRAAAKRSPRGTRVFGLRPVGSGAVDQAAGESSRSSHSGPYRHTAAPPSPEATSTGAARLLETLGAPAGRKACESALSAVSAALRSNPLDASLYLLRAELEQELSEHREAIRDARRALLIDPNAAYAYLLVALSALATRRVSLAERSIRSGRRVLSGLAQGATLSFSSGLTPCEVADQLASVEQAARLNRYRLP